MRVFISAPMILRPGSSDDVLALSRSFVEQLGFAGEGLAANPLFECIHS
jgi:hypothetical protein